MWFNMLVAFMPEGWRWCSQAKMVWGQAIRIISILERKRVLEISRTHHQPTLLRGRCKLLARTQIVYWTVMPTRKG